MYYSSVSQTEDYDPQENCGKNLTYTKEKIAIFSEKKTNIFKNTFIRHIDKNTFIKKLKHIYKNLFIKRLYIQSIHKVKFFK